MRIIETIRELLDPMILILFSLVFGYCLVVDVPGLNRKGLMKEAKAITILAWVSIGLSLGMLVIEIVL